MKEGKVMEIEKEEMPSLNFNLSDIEKEIIAKMLEMGIKNFNNKELNRVFSGCVGSRYCVGIAKQLIHRGFAFLTLKNKKLLRKAH
jgi:hypothetical protein